MGQDQLKPPPGFVEESGGLQIPPGFVLDTPIEQAAPEMRTGVPIKRPSIPARVGRGLLDVGQGLKQRWLEATDLPAAREYQKKVESGIKAYEAGIDSPDYVRGIASVLPVLPTALIPGGNSIAGSVMVGGLLGAAQPTTSGESVSDNIKRGMATGGLGAVAAKTFGKVVNPKIADVKSPKAQAVEDIQELGGRATPGQILNNRPLQQLEASMSSFPPTSGPLARIGEENQRVINRAVSRALGEDSDVIDKAVLQKAESRIGGVYDAVGSNRRNYALNVNNAAHDVGVVANEVRGVVDVQADPLVQEFLSLASSGTATGKQLTDLSRRLWVKAKQEVSSQTGNRNLGLSLFKVREIVDDSLQNQLSPQERAAFSKARENYRNLMSIVSNPSIANTATGDISAPNLGNYLSRKERAAFVFGKGNPSPETEDMYKAVEAARALRPIVGDSGTSTRGFLPWLLASSGLAGATGMLSGSQEAALMGALSPFALAGGANAVSRLYGSKALERTLSSKPVQTYLGRGIFPQARKAVANSAKNNKAIAQALLLGNRLPVAGALAIQPKQ